MTTTPHQQAYELAEQHLRDYAAAAPNSLPAPTPEDVQRVLDAYDASRTFLSASQANEHIWGNLQDRAQTHQGLDTLPPGTVVSDAKGRVFQRVPDGDTLWLTPRFIGTFPTAAIQLPARVLQ